MTNRTDRFNSIAWSIALPSISFILATSAIVGAVAFQRGRAAAASTLNLLEKQIEEKIKNDLQLYIDNPRIINQLNADAFTYGQLNFQIDTDDDKNKLFEYFRNQLTTFRGDSSDRTTDSGAMANNIYIGLNNGYLYGVEYREEEGQLAILKSDESTRKRFTRYSVNAEGVTSSNPIKEPEEEEFEATGRDWYKAAQGEAEPVWSKFYKDRSTGKPAITSALAIKNKSGKTLGVLGSDLLQDEIEEFIRNLADQVSGNSYIFILDKNGKIIATSLGHTTYLDQGSNKIEMIDASKISEYNSKGKFSKSNNLIQEVSKEFKDNGYKCSEKEFPDKFLQKRELLSPISVADSYGLNWCTFAVIPASDHIASMLSEIIKFIAICLPILVGAGYLSVRKAFKISDPIIQLKESVDSFSGELVTNSEANFSRASEPDAPHEIRELAEAFNRMGDNLRKNISNLRRSEQDLRRSEQDLGVTTEELILTKERLEHLNKTLSQFVPDEFFRLLNKDVNDIRLGDNKRTRLTILFSDIRSFTSISESLSPRDNFSEINRFLGEMEPEITNNALHAVEAGINMHRKIPLLNQERKADNPLAKDIEIGVGIHTGDLMIGIIGGNNRMETTVISQNVNLASRLEGLTKHFGAKLIISEVTLKDISPSDRRRFNLRYLGPVVPKGSTDPVRIHEVLDADEPEIMKRKLEYKEKFEDALRLGIERKFEDALNIFKEIFIDYPEDKAVHFLMEKCERRSDFREELSVK